MSVYPGWRSGSTCSWAATRLCTLFPNRPLPPRTPARTAARSPRSTSARPRRSRQIRRIPCGIQTRDQHTRELGHFWDDVSHPLHLGTKRTYNATHDAQLLIGLMRLSLLLYDTHRASLSSTASGEVRSTFRTVAVLSRTSCISFSSYDYHTWR